MKSYLNYFKLRLMTNLQYRTAALAGISTQLFFGLFYIMLYLAIYESNKSANAPMDLNNLITYMWLQQAFFATTYPYYRDQELLNMIKNGNIAYELIRPQNFYLKYFIKMLSQRLVATLLRCLPIIIIGLILPYPYKLSLPVSINSFILFIISILLSCLLVISLSLIVHIISMFVLDYRGISSTYCVLSELFVGMIIPIPFLPSWLIKIGDFLPFKYIGDFPYRVYSGDISISLGKNMLFYSFIWLIICIIIGYFISKKALRKAVIQGG